MVIKNVWIVSNYSMPPQYEMRIKNIKYAHNLKARGIDCTFFTASTIHNTNINLITDNSLFVEKEYDNIKFVHIKCSNYSGNGLKRIINMKQFAKRFAKIAPSFNPPDVVLTDVYCPMFRPIFRFCKKNSIPVFLDVRDLWPLSIVAYLKFSNMNPIIRYLYKEEHVMYRLADGIIFAMEGGEQYIKDKGWKDIDSNKLFHINNGIDYDSFNESILKYDYCDSDLDDNSSFKVVYIGSVRKVNGLKVLCDAADIIRHKIPNTKVLIFGDGDEKDFLKSYCLENDINNVYFKGFVQKKYIPNILSKGNINVLNYQLTEVLKYGACQNKIFDYLASGRITVCNARGNYNLFERYKCGIVTDAFDAESTAKAIIEAYNMDETEKKKMIATAKEVAQKYDYKKLTEQLLEVFNSVCK